MPDKTALIEEIISAFADVKYPGDWCLSRSNEGFEPAETAAAFKGKTDRYAIDGKLLDQVPNGLSSAMSFFSDEAFRFYLPAYMIADVRGQLEQVDVPFHLTHGLDNKSRKKLINPLRYGQRTWFDAASHKFSVFTSAQASAVVAYLKYRNKKVPDYESNHIEEALANYWNARIASN